MSLPAPTALLFGLSGCLTDFGARTLPVALQRLHPHRKLPGILGTPPEALHRLLGQIPTASQWQALQQTLSEVAAAHTELTPGAAQLLATLHADAIHCAWLDDLPAAASMRLAAALPQTIKTATAGQERPWPAPDHCWQALSQLGVDGLAGCIVISGNPQLLQAGLNAGCWTIGLAACGTLCGLAPDVWRAQGEHEREQQRAQATLQLYRLGAHSVIDHLGEIGPSLADIGARRAKGEKP